MAKTKFVTVRKLVERICNSECDLDYVIGFTLDTPEIIDGGREPSGWFGVTVSSLFDGVNFIIGYYGGGIEVCVSKEWDIDDVIRSFINFMKDDGVKDANENSLVCVDADEFDNAF